MIPGSGPANIHYDATMTLTLKAPLYRNWVLAKLAKVAVELSQNGKSTLGPLAFDSSHFDSLRRL